MIPQDDEYRDALAAVLRALIEGGPDAARRALQPIAYPRHDVPSRPAMPCSVMLAVFWRDHWTCRYCGGRTIFTPVMALLGTLFPDQFPFHRNWKGGQTHPAVVARSAVVDHVIPGAHGGSWADPENLATACWPCNARKGDLTIRQLGWDLRPIEPSERDGLTDSYQRVWELAGRPTTDAHPEWIRGLVASRASA
ncbi:MAG: HNH endonuclease [Candidatus Dormibacteraeota bacterium]|nr:HNH endonuclease [Candidatus Dormibacteraeota bacterium]